MAAAGPWSFPLLSVGILFSSVRCTLALGIIAIGVMLGLRSNRPRVAAAGGRRVGFVTYLLAAPVLGAGGRVRQRPVSHQLGGIARPFDDESSTAEHSHLELMGNGLQRGVRTRWGREWPRTVTGDSGRESRYCSGATESDFSDTFVRFGLPGGVLFIVLTSVALVTSRPHTWSDPRPLVLGALGIAVVTLGFWLNGGHYVLTPCSG